MSILYLRRSNVADRSGDTVFDNQVVEALRKGGATVECLSIPSHKHLGTVLFGLLSGIPPTMAGYGSIECARVVLEETEHKNYELVIVSHESLIPIVHRLPTDSPKTVILHNLFSQIFDRGLSAYRCLRFLYRNAEKSIGNQSNVSLCFISKREHRLARNIGLIGAEPNVLLLPGMPTNPPPPSPTTMSRELLISGTHGWNLKRRDTKWFAKSVMPLLCKSDLKPCRLLVSRDVIFPGSGTLVQTIDLPPTDTKLRVGIITDRFVLGFKLKALWYIHHNCLIISFSDIREEFQSLRGFKRVIRYVESPAEFIDEWNSLQSESTKELLAEFQEFKENCSKEFNWYTQCHRSGLLDLRACDATISETR